jgi:hypothetical protein
VVGLREVASLRGARTQHPQRDPSWTKCAICLLSSRRLALRCRGDESSRWRCPCLAWRAAPRRRSPSVG